MPEICVSARKDGDKAWQCQDGQDGGTEGWTGDWRTEEIILLWRVSSHQLTLMGSCSPSVLAHLLCVVFVLLFPPPPVICSWSHRVSLAASFWLIQTFFSGNELVSHHTVSLSLSLNFSLHYSSLTSDAALTDACPLTACVCICAATHLYVYPAYVSLLYCVARGLCVYLCVYIY